MKFWLGSLFCQVKPTPMSSLFRYQRKLTKINNWGDQLPTTCWKGTYLIFAKIDNCMFCLGSNSFSVNVVIVKCAIDTEWSMKKKAIPERVRQRLCSCGCGDERPRSLTSCTSCWDTGSHHNPARNRRGWVLLAQTLQKKISLSVTHYGQENPESLCYDVPLCVHPVIILQEKQHDSSHREPIFKKVFNKKMNSKDPGSPLSKCLTFSPIVEWILVDAWWMIRHQQTYSLLVKWPFHWQLGKQRVCVLIEGWQTTGGAADEAENIQNFWNTK